MGGFFTAIGKAIAGAAAATPVGALAAVAILVGGAIVLCVMYC